MKIGITGGTGLLGRNLALQLSKKDHEIKIFSRSGKIPSILEANPKIISVRADIPYPEDMDGLDVFINLAGEPIIKGKWNRDHKKQIWTSRVDFTKKIVFQMQKLKKRPSVFLSGSAIGFYGMFEDSDPLCKEDSPPGTDFLATLCAEWEKEALVAKELGVRVVLGRIGIVLSPQGGALAQMLPAFKMFVGGPLGSGKQFMSWIHIQDILNAFEFLIESEKSQGAYNLSAPSPVSNTKFSSTLGKVLGRPSIIRAPGFALDLLFGEGSDVVLKGQNVIPDKLISQGFRFQFPDLEKALESFNL